MDHPPAHIARGTLLDKTPDGRGIVLGVPGRDYRISLVAKAPIETPVGQRIAGILTVRALRIDVCHTGGNYIDPVYGQPRIVQGRILAIDPEEKALVVRAAIPILVLVRPPQRAEQFRHGDLITFGVESGATFEPAPRLIRAT